MPTITEALAQIKVLDKRLVSKRQTVGDLLLRPSQLKDPMAAEDGGSAGVVARERQAIGDLEEQRLKIRTAIHEANVANSVTIGTTTRTIADWLVWRREIYPGQSQFLSTLRNHISTNRKTAQTKGAKIATADDQAEPGDLIINLNEAQLASQIEEGGAAYEALDGQLSLKNATIVIEY